MPASCRGKPCGFKALAQILGQIVGSGADKIGGLGHDLSGTEIGGLADRWDETLTTAGMRPRRDGDHGGVGGGFESDWGRKNRTLIESVGLRQSGSEESRPHSQEEGRASVVI